MTAIVTLLTDFGTVDGFVGAMKGIILNRAPHATVIDITHDIPPQDIHCGAWALREAAATFPRGTVHVAVVDPGVGTARRPLLLSSRGHFFIGPDNGLLSLASEPGCPGWILDRPTWHNQPVSSTFHGRDIFASVAGYLAAEISPQDCGSPVSNWIKIEEPVSVQKTDTIQGQVLHIDRFGNLITNISQQLVGTSDAWIVKLADRPIGPIHQTFGDVSWGEWVAYWGSSHLLEIGIYGKNAAAEINYRGGSAEAIFVHLIK